MLLLVEQKCIYESLMIIPFTIAIVEEVCSVMDDDDNPSNIRHYFNHSVSQGR